jgi:hypothetical protein
MRQFWTLLLSVALITSCSKSWTPPRNPNPDKILNEAVADTQNGKYTDALAKHVWFFQNSLKYEPALYGVRLSYALSDWVELGKVYPPALGKLKVVRDEAGTNIRNGKNVRDNFADFESINKELSEDSKTVDLFAWLDSNQKDSAKAVFDLAQPALVKSKQYPLLGKYTQNPFKALNDAIGYYEMNAKLAEDPKFGKRLQDFADKKFINDTTTLIAILVLTDRKPYAETIVKEIRGQTDLPKFDKEIQKALNGEVPPPWP